MNSKSLYLILIIFLLLMVTGIISNIFDSQIFAKKVVIALSISLYSCIILLAAIFFKIKGGLFTALISSFFHVRITEQLLGIEKNGTNIDFTLIGQISFFLFFGLVIGKISSSKKKDKVSRKIMNKKGRKPFSGASPFGKPYKERVMKSARDLGEEGNPKYFKDLLSNYINERQIAFETFSIVFFEIDFSKISSDILVHQIRNIIFSKVIFLIQENLRAGDCISKYGGESIFIILENMEFEEAFNVANNIVKKFDKTPFEADDSLYSIAATFGIAVFPINGRNSLELINSAKAALPKKKMEKHNIL